MKNVTVFTPEASAENLSHRVSLNHSKSYSVSKSFSPKRGDESASPGRSRGSKSPSRVRERAGYSRGSPVKIRDESISSGRSS